MKISCQILLSSSFFENVHIFHIAYCITPFKDAQVKPTCSPHAEEASWTVLDDDVEHVRAEEFLCLSERFLAYRPLFPPDTEFCFDAASKRICVVADRYSSRSGSILLIKQLQHEALDILSDGILPDCGKCNKDAGELPTETDYPHQPSRCDAPWFVRPC